MKRLIVGITGASGVRYGVRLLELLRPVPDVETHLIFTQAAKVTLAHETEFKVRDVVELADVHYSNEDIAACLASGSTKTMGMIVAPCSMKSLGEIANGVSSHLLSRSADVVLKERRRLVLMVRETPLTLAHLRNMERVTEMGGIIYPPVPAFYARPNTLEDMVDHTLGRAMELFDIELGTVKRWKS